TSPPPSRPTAATPRRPPTPTRSPGWSWPPPPPGRGSPPGGRRPGRPAATGHWDCPWADASAARWDRHLAGREHQVDTATAWQVPDVDKGGHFAAWQEPDLFTTEVRAPTARGEPNGRSHEPSHLI